MAEEGQVRITPSGSSRSQGRGQRRRVHRRRTYFYNDSDSEPEVIRNVPRARQNELRDRRAERREREKKFREFKEFKMGPDVSVPEHVHLFKIKRAELANYVEITDWEALAILADSLREPWGEILTEIYHDVWPSAPFSVYEQELVFDWYMDVLANM